MAINRKRMKTCKTAMAFAIAVSLALAGFSAYSGGTPPAEARSVLPEAVLKKPVPVVEDSVSTYVPSSVAPGNGIAVNIIYPEKVRYKAGAPIAIVVSGNESTSLTMSMHAANSGIAEVRFAYPGCGMRQFHSDGIFDNFGDSCGVALKDVILFMKGETNDYKGRSVRELIPVSLDQSVLGLVAWETGANIALVTLAKHQEKIPFVSYLAFFEGAAGCMFSPDNLGTVKDMYLNRHYREGSAATGQILVDYRKLMYSPGARRHPGVAKKRGETELKGVLYFDENNNKTWDEAAEFALNYASEVGLDQQIYAPPITEALARHKVFEKLAGPGETRAVPVNSANAAGQKPGENKDTATKADADKKAAQSADGKKDDTKKADFKMPSLRNLALGIKPGKAAFTEKKPKSAEQAEEMLNKMISDKTNGMQDDARKATTEKLKKLVKNCKSFEEAKLLIFNYKIDRSRWPSTIAKLPTSRAYFDARDGALYIKDVVANYPKMLFGLFGARVAHTQRQPDHPHIAYLYNKLFECKPKWLRLNPEPVYVSTICRMNVNNFSANEPNSSLDATNIVEHLAPLGLVPEYAYMDALVAELSDRAKSGNLKFPLASTLSDYTPIPDPRKVEPKPESKTAGSQESTGTKEAAGTSDKSSGGN
ncbi:MAG: hypothetical protein K2Y39_15435 [Candidatus Obscuribacterales bacterium]|nr:hypothetical protein [Candidatus Obscuribacterales bacterium]